MPGTKTFGRYSNGDTIPAQGKTSAQVIQEAIFQAIPPTASITSSSTVAFGITNVSIVIARNITLPTPNAAVQSISLERRRGGTGPWTVISTADIVSYTDTFTQTLYDTSTINYRYILTDTFSQSVTATLDITPTAYVAPTIGSISVGDTTRYRGATNTTYVATITRQSPQIAITSYQLQRSIDGGSNWTNVGSTVSVTGNPASVNINITDTNNSDTNVRNTNNLTYRVSVVDSFQTTNIGANNPTINFVHRNALLFNSNTSIAISDIDNAALTASTSPGAILQNARSRVVNSVTATAGQYTYYAYSDSSGNLTGVTQDGALPTLDAFLSTGVSPITLNGVNANNATVSYKVYRSNSTQAFNNASLAFV